MRTVKTADLAGPALDWAVAKAEGHNVVVLGVEEQRDRWLEHVPSDELAKEAREYDEHFAPTAKPKLCVLSEENYKRTPYHTEAVMLYRMGIPRFQFSTSWAQAGPIIERERIALKPRSDHWSAELEYLPADDEDYRYGAGFGSTPLTAAMRCYVASKLGDTVEVPDELGA